MSTEMSGFSQIFYQNPVECSFSTQIMCTLSSKPITKVTAHFNFGVKVECFILKDKEQQTGQTYFANF